MRNHYIYINDVYVRYHDMTAPEAFALAYADYQKPPCDRREDWKDSMYFTPRWEIESNE